MLCRDLAHLHQLLQWRLRTPMPASCAAGRPAGRLQAARHALLVLLGLLLHLPLGLPVLLVDVALRGGHLAGHDGLGHLLMPQRCPAVAPDSSEGQTSHGK